MAYSKARRLSDLISADGTSFVTAAHITDGVVAAADLHSTLDLTGKTVTVATASAGDNDTTVASTAFVSTAVSNLVDSAPGTLNTLNELAAALGDDANFSTTVTDSIATKAPLANPDFTGQIQVSNAASTIQELTVTGNNTRSTLRLNSKDSSGNSVDLRMHSLGDGPRAELFTYSNHDLAFATNNGAPQITLKTSGNFGIGTSSPNQLLSVKGRINSDLNDDYYGAWLDGNSAASQDNFLGLGPWHNNAGYIKFFQSSAPDRLSIYTTSTGDHVTLQEAGGNVGIGATSPNYQLHIKKTGSAEIELEGTVSAELNLHDSGGTANQRRARLSMNGTDFKLSALNDADDTVTHEFISMQTDTGMVGIAKAAPIAWGSGYKSLQIGGRGYIGAHSGSDLYVGQNAYYNSGWKYEASVAASLTQHSGGQITHKVAGAGTAGNAISWINAIHIKPTGEVGIQTTSPQAKLSVNTPLTQASADLRAIDIVVPGSWSLSGNAGHTSDITWTNAEAAGNYVMGKFGLRYAGTSTGGSSEFVFKDMYQGGYGASVDAMYVGSNGIVMHPNQPYFEAYRSGNETGFNASNSYAQVVVYNSVGANIGGHYNSSTGYFTAPVTGVYSFVAAAYTNFTCGQAWFSSTGGRLGGTDMVLNGMGNFPAAWITIRMSANDTIGFHPYASGTTSGTINANGNHTYFRGALIG